MENEKLESKMMNAYNDLCIELRKLFGDKISVGLSIQKVALSKIAQLSESNSDIEVETINGETEHYPPYHYVDILTENGGLIEISTINYTPEYEVSFIADKP